MKRPNSSCERILKSKTVHLWQLTVMDCVEYFQLEVMHGRHAQSGDEVLAHDHRTHVRLDVVTQGRAAGRKQQHSTRATVSI